MIDAGATEYDLLLVPPSGEALSLGEAVTQLSWGEQADEFAERLQATVAVLDLPSDVLAALLALGAKVLLRVRWGGAWRDRFLGTVVVREYADSGQPAVALTAFDDLWWLMRSEGHYLYDAGTPARLALESMYSEWELPVGRIAGPEAPMPRLVLRGTIAEHTRDILTEAYYRTGRERRHIVRCRLEGGRNVLDVVPQGGNEPVYWLDAAGTVSGVRDSRSMEQLVTQVVAMGQAAPAGEDDETAGDREAVLETFEHPDPAVRAFGLLRAIVAVQKNDSPGMAATRAANLFDERGQPAQTYSVAAADLPLLRRGDLVGIAAGTLNGEHVVSSVEHDAATGTMQLTIDTRAPEHYRERQGEPPAPPSDEDGEPDVPEDVARRRDAERARRRAEMDAALGAGPNQVTP